MGSPVALEDLAVSVLSCGCIRPPGMHTAAVEAMDGSWGKGGGCGRTA